jgi:hypothetical protein
LYEGGQQHMRVEISVGDYFDKLSIINIKESKIMDKSKLEYINSEKKYLLSLLGDFYFILNDFNYLRLCELNELLWESQEVMREKEKLKHFDEEFIEMARNVNIWNDERFRCKAEINKLTRSLYKEQKSYEGIL